MNFRPSQSDGERKPARPLFLSASQRRRQQVKELFCSVSVLVLIILLVCTLFFVLGWYIAH